jgi:hypothetical protein
LLWLVHQISILPPPLCQDFSFAFHFPDLQCALDQVLVSSKARGVFFGLSVSIFTGLCSICVLPKVSAWIFLPRLSSLLSFWFLLSDVQGVSFLNQARRSSFSSPVHFFSLRLGCPVLNLCR